MTLMKMHGRQIYAPAARTVLRNLTILERPRFGPVGPVSRIIGVRPDSGKIDRRPRTIPLGG